MNVAKAQKNDKIKQNETRVKALRVAKSFLQTKGLNGFSFQNIADILGIQKASLHYYFSSKEELTAELIKTYIKAFEEWSLKYESESCKVRLEAVIKMFLDMIGKDFRICPMGALTVDFYSLPAESQKLLLELHHAQREWLLKTFEKGITEKYLVKNLELNILVDQLMALIQGGMQMAKIRADQKVLSALLNNFIQNLNSRR